MEVPDTIAVACGANGDFASAVDFGKQAIDIAKKENKPLMAARIRKRVELYKNKKTYLESY